MKSFNLLATFLLMLILLSGCASQPDTPDTKVTKSAPPKMKREFEFTYSADITDIPRDANDVRIWFPIPQSDENQDISRLRINTTEGYKVYTEPVYGNKIGYIHVNVQESPPADIPLVLSFDVTRYEDHGERNPVLLKEDAGKYLKPSRRGAITPEVEEAASRIGQSQSEPRHRARETFRYVIDNMEYKKDGTGWGHGDTVWACSAGYGNCTDYHALFIAMSQALGVPANFEIGFPLPPGRSEGAIGGYHCWAHYYLPDRGWVPVDVSEADKRPSLEDYFFGAHDPNRVKFTTGRDIVLEPAQQGEPLNYFIYPYVEVDGVPYDKMTLSFGFRDLKG